MKVGSFKQHKKHSSRKNTLKKIHCLNHVVGVLRYLACDQGQIKTRCDKDGLTSLFHTHYPRQSISAYYRHSRGKAREEIHTGISRLLSKHIRFFEKRKLELAQPS